MTLVFAACVPSEKENRKTIDNIQYEVSSMETQNKDLITFKLVISEPESAKRIKEYYKPANYNLLLQYCNQKVKDDLSLVNDKESYAPVMVQFEPNMKITNRLIFLVAFNKVTSKEDVIFQYDDNLFNNGIVKFNISKV
jgi:hypothetical protein